MGFSRPPALGDDNTRNSDDIAGASPVVTVRSSVAAMTVACEGSERLILA